MTGGLDPMVLRILADASQLRREMDTAQGVVSRAGAGMEKAWGAAKMALGGLVAGLSVGALAGWVKGAIDAADEASKLAQKAGVATSEVAGLQMAFKLSGVGAEAMGSTMARLSKQVADGNDAFKTLGVSTRNADGSLRGTKDVLYDVADAFAGMENGTARTALAVKLFGRSGADLIPLLAGGSEGMKQMDETARKLGLTISDQVGKDAETFNDTLDLIKMSGQGVATQVAAQLLPTLSNLAGSFFTTLTEGDGLRTVANALSFALKGLFIGGVFGVEVFTTLGKVIGGTAAAIVSVMQGEFRQAGQIIKDTASDVADGWGRAGTQIKGIWSETGDTTVEQTARVLAAGRKVVVQSDEQRVATKKQVDEHAKLLESYRKLADAGEARAAQAQAEAAAGRKLTEEERDYIKVMADVRDGKVRLNDLIRTGTLQRLQENLAAAQTRQRLADEAKAVNDAAKARDKYFGDMDRETAKIAEQARQLEQSNAQTRVSRDVLMAQEVAQTRASAARLRDIALIEEQMGGSAELTQRLREQAAALDRLATAREGSIGAGAAREAGGAWADVAKQIGQGLTDSLYRAFESGKGFFKTLWDGIRNTFKTTVLRLAVDAVMRPVQGAIGSLLGSFLPGAASAGTGGGGLGDLGNLASLLGAAWSTFGGTALAGLTSWGAGLSGVGGMLSAGSTLMGAGNVAAGLGAFAGALGPVALGVLALSQLRHKATPHTGSVVGLDAGGLRTLMGDGSQITNTLSQETDTALRALVAGSAGSLNELAQAFGLQAQFSGTAKFAADGKDASIGQFILGRDGDIAGQVGTGATSLTGGGQFAFYTPDREAAYLQYAQEVAGVTRQALAGLDLPEWAQAEIAKLGAGASLDQIAELAADLVQRQRSGNTSGEDDYAGGGPAFEPIGRNEMLDELRMLRERVDLVTAAVERLTTSAEAGLAGAAAASRDTTRVLERWSDGDAVLTRAAT